MKTVYREHFRYNYFVIDMYFTMFNVCSIIRCDSGCEELPTIMSGGLKWVMQAILRSEGGARGGAVKKDFLQIAQGSEYCCTIFGDRTCTNILMGSSMGGGGMRNILGLMMVSTKQS